MSKMGISTIASYTGAQVFEALGLSQDLVDEYFTGTTSRLGGIGLDVIAEEVAARHRKAYPENATERAHRKLDIGGEYQWRREGEVHLFNPETVFRLQHSTRTQKYDVFKEYTSRVDELSTKAGTLRGLFAFKGDRTPVPIDEVEPVSEIVKRFNTGAMSLGSISPEAHETLAIAMNQLGGRSNTGEGGEDPERLYDPTRRSAIKQVASGRFGVTSEYLVNADDIQIKMAQGAKPGEGGQLPGPKVNPYIAKTRHSTPGVGLISPPPHHDIYSIEDLAQLIHDLKNANDTARIHVKLVAEVGVGTVAAGVSKAHADVVLISGHDGGTGASPLTSLKHAGSPWELGLAETQQTLLLNGLRDRIVVQVDGQLKTGRDVVIGALLGAEEYGFATAPLVGQRLHHDARLPPRHLPGRRRDAERRSCAAKYSGKAEYLVTFFEYIAQEVREILAELGFRTLQEAIGHTEVLDTRKAVEHWKASGLDLAPVLHMPELPEGASLTQVVEQDHGLAAALDNELIELAEKALTDGTPVHDRRAGAQRQPHRRHDARRRGHPPLRRRRPARGHDRHHPHRLGRPVVRRVPARAASCCGCYGDANDYVGKGLSGGRVVVRPAEEATFAAEDNVIAGNTLLYGATGGSLFVRGRVGERFCVRNSGATAVVEGVGDHACEYMTGGRVAILGPTGRNVAAGMSGGVAYLLDLDVAKVNREMVDLEALAEGDVETLRQMLTDHLRGDRLRRRRAAARRRRLAEPLHQGDAARLQEGADRDGAGARGRDRRRRGRHGREQELTPWPNPQGFLEHGRELPQRRPVDVRIRDWKEVYEEFPADHLHDQAARCMDCGIPFCHNGCPLGNLIPEWNDLVWKDDWTEASERLHATNNFPEFTGRLCPAPCEAACVLGINDDPVTIKQVEVEIADRAWRDGLITPQPPMQRTGRSVAVVGSGPAGLAAAQQLTRAGHDVVVLERADRIGGLLRYGIPEFKMEKAVLERRLEQMRAEGTEFRTGVDVGVDVTVEQLREQYDAVLLAGGSTLGRDLPVEGRDLDGIHLAMEYLVPSNRVQEGDLQAPPITAEGKDVVIIGGGDTGADCLGTAIRQGARSITQLEIMPRPPQERPDTTPWPTWPLVYRTSSAHEEGGERLFSVNTKRFVGEGRPRHGPGAGRRRDGRRPVRAGRGQRAGPARAAGHARHGLHRTAAQRPARGARRRARRARQRRPRRRVGHERAGRLRRRRHGPRPVAHRLGDRRGPRRGRRRRPVAVRRHAAPRSGPPYLPVAPSLAGEAPSEDRLHPGSRDPLLRGGARAGLRGHGRRPAQLQPRQLRAAQRGLHLGAAGQRRVRPRRRRPRRPAGPEDPARHLRRRAGRLGDRGDGHHHDRRRRRRPRPGVDDVRRPGRRRHCR